MSVESTCVVIVKVMVDRILQTLRSRFRRWLRSNSLSPALWPHHEPLGSLVVPICCRLVYMASCVIEWLKSLSGSAHLTSVGMVKDSAAECASRSRWLPT